MRSWLLTVGLLTASISFASAQSRLSIAPTYWFNYNPYSYQADMSFNGVQNQILASGHNTVSSLGVTVRYHFTSQWNLSIGGLYSLSTNHIKSPQSTYGEPSSFTSKGVQLPLLLSYRLTTHRLSPYFSAGALVNKSLTFTDEPVRIDGVAGVGLDYQLNSGLSLLVQPTVTYSFTQPKSDAFYQVTNYSSYNLGLQTQLVWRF